MERVRASIQNWFQRLKHSIVTNGDFKYDYNVLNLRIIIFLKNVFCNRVKIFFCYNIWQD